MLGPFADSANRISHTSRTGVFGFILVGLKEPSPLKSSYRKYLFDNPSSIRKLLILDMVRIDSRSIDAAHSLHRGVKMVKRMLLDQGGNLGRNPIKRFGFVNKHRPICFHDRFNDGLLVKRSD
jgi:hypothetical protein